ncbi:MAG: GAF domain-containing protein, partial [Anaerolineae bacterium]|nr:GAF domain-containing protein [Anaerolineae bacterium]
MIYTPFVWLQLVAAVLMAGLALYARRFRGVPAAKPFAVMMWLAAFWALEYGLYMSITSLPLKVFLMNLRMTFGSFLPLVVLWLALEHTGRGAWLTRRRLALLLVVPVFTVLLAWASDYHSLYRYNPRLNPDAPFPLLIWDRGPLYWVTQSYSVMVVLGAVWILIRSLRARGLLRNTLVLIVGILIPLSTDVLYDLGITPWRGYNPTSTTLVITGTLLAWALLRFRLFGAAPVARNAAMDAIDDLVVVLDTDDNLVDFNRAAQAACGLAHSNGAMPDALPPAWAGLLQRYPGLATGKEQLTLDWGQGPHIYDLTVSVVHDARRQALGRLFVLHDVTARKQMDEIIHLRLRLLEFVADHSLQELMQRALDEIGQLTHSPIGFYHFVEADQKTLALQAWSTRTLQEFCTAEGKGAHYGLDEAGVWVDCVRQRGPVIHNDYASLPHR